MGLGFCTSSAENGWLNSNQPMLLDLLCNVFDAFY